MKTVFGETTTTIKVATTNKFLIDAALKVAEMQIEHALLNGSYPSPGQTVNFGLVCVDNVKSVSYAEIEGSDTFSVSLVQYLVEDTN